MRNTAALVSGAAVLLLLGSAHPAGAQHNIYDLGVASWTQDVAADKTNRVHIAWTNGGALYYGQIENNALKGTVLIARGITTTFWRPYLSVQPDGSSVHIASTSGGQGNELNAFLEDRGRLHRRGEEAARRDPDGGEPVEGYG